MLFYPLRLMMFGYKGCIRFDKRCSIIFLDLFKETTTYKPCPNGVYFCFLFKEDNLVVTAPFLLMAIDLEVLSVTKIRALVMTALTFPS